ncbi:MAG: cell division ATP-binding protein FtsE [Chloroflexi bacterium]|nr:MAG: cell division ATP-binding protein FtsE [Chloroflexota bacterium]TMG34953.1 MAG: cell division ATP-binding protein FtsE [Chloroflexota bacterium]TMG37538.1 MAG: cell division ATP-binding protein FtsE [Chloroflexota bacterium]
MIALDDVSKRYPNGTQALRDVDLSIDSGDFVFLVGSSGAGKSTLIRLLIREEVPSSGKVWVDGQDVVRMRHSHVPRLRRKVGVVFQDFKLLPTRTVAENVAFALLVTGHSGDEVREETDRVLSLVGLAQRRDHFPDQLSGGEQQRTAMARALVNRPRILIADEPTGNLDPVTSWEIIKLLVRVNELGTTLVMATHNAEIVNALRRRVVHLDHGAVVRDEREGLYAA